MLTPGDIRGVYVLPPTPCKEGADRWDATDSVDYDEFSRMLDFLIQPGVGGIGLFGTTGEGGTLLWEEKLRAAEVAVQVNRQRTQIFAGATALGTREAVRQMRALRDVGVDGALVGLPLWQTPTVENAVQFYADLGEAVPDLPVMLYSNSWFFKTSFPVALWEGLARRAPTVICSKNAHGFDHYREELAAVGDRIQMIPGEFGIFLAYKLAPDSIRAVWSTQAALGPEPLVAFMDALRRGDGQRAEEIKADFDAVPPFAPPGGMKNRDLYDAFAQYNIQAAKWRSEAAGLFRVGPPRAPYYDLPDEWKRQAEAEAQGFLAMRQKYLPAAVP
jgi:trans-o-hydroxybenzylidenepyruvate hydratase-aldolase